MARVVACVLLLMFISCCLGQNITKLQELCNNNGKPLHVSLISIPTKGHINPLLGVGQQLVQLGCRVTVPIVETKLDWVNFGGLEPIAITLLEGEIDELEVEKRKEFSKDTSRNMILQTLIWLANSSKNFTSPLQAIYDFAIPIGRHLLSENAQGRYNPDIIITERFLSVIVDIADVLKVPVVALHPTLHFDILADPIHYIPAYGMKFPLNMSYLQRVISYYVIPTVIKASLDFWTGPAYEARKSLGISEQLSDVHPFDRRPVLELVQTCWGIEYPRPVLPTTHFIGPILPLTLKAIPEHILQWVDKDDKEIVYMCLGTMVTITPEIATAFLDAFAGADFRVLWSLPLNQRDLIEGFTIPENVQLESFVPQREILLLDKIKVFITHAGASSSNEALTSGTPVLCMPYFGDQPEFCSRFVNLGAGFFLDKDNLNATEIRELLFRVLRDPVVREDLNRNAKKLQRVMDCGGSLKAAELVLDSYYTGSEHLFPNSVHLPWYQKTALDLRLTEIVFFMSLPFVIYYVFKFLRCCLRCCLCSRSKAKLKTQ